jgi:TonB family protein
LRTKIVSAFRVSKFIFGSVTRKADHPTEQVPAVAAVEQPNFEASLPQPAPRINRTRTLEVYASSAPVTRSVPLHDRNSSNPAASSADVDMAAIRPEIPPSLMVPVTAMTSRARETRLSASPANKWSVEPILLPENVSRELLVRQIVPQYPQLAAAAGVEGSVLLHALVAKDGSIQDLKLISGPLILGRAAFDSVKQWRYRPYRLNGQVVEMQTFVTVNFLRSPTTSVAQK